MTNSPTLRKLSSLRESLINLGGKLHDLEIEAGAIERYAKLPEGSLPELIQNEYELGIVLQGYLRIEVEIAAIEKQLKEQI